MSFNILNSLVKPNYDLSMVEGDFSIYDRLSMMVDQVMDSRSNKLVYKIKGEILRKLPVRDYDAEVKAIFYWVRDNIRYTRDPVNLELFMTPRASISDGVGDCDDMAICLVALLRSAGYICRFRVVGMEKGVYQHVYVVVGIPPEEPTRWVPLDPSQPFEPGWEVDRKKVVEIFDYIIEEEDKL